MNVAVSLLTFLPLFVVAFAHFLWGVGYSWPLPSDQHLAQTVIGRPGLTRMPHRLALLCVAVLIFAAGVAAMALADHDGGGSVRTGLGVLLAAIFLGRGVLGYTDWWRARHPVEPFATLDRRNYSPLCLWVGAGFLIMVVLRLI